ncbi:hypothetical protein HSTV2_40 [Halorubrum sodomense tailed virus 2]|uniref:Uncharacterized protein n=1 Tax=Halorubrum sodomense tailed virus 2 TaxID=1262527 RepID=L7TGL2_9CAUD|nr:hypothetical protein HSTV2_40 [Halorubrum sodomense tailed virus 2]AGC34309.1 hypothetical protein HSTV2_40 [Halorubrum sodomense tailed virus 2]
MKMFDLTGATETVRDLSNYVRPDGSSAEDEPDEDRLIEFVTEKELYGAIPEPVPANKILPEWYRNLNPFMDGTERKSISSSTVKRCMPFMEALTMGWLIPLAAEVQFYAEDGYVSYEWGFQREMVSSHSLEQVGGEAFPNHEWPVLKFHNHWCIKVPEGYSLLVTNPMNRIEPRWQTFSGVVDADNYFNYINAPFMWTGGDWEGVAEAGTPIVQVIPFKRDSMLTDAVVREMTEREKIEQQKTKTELSSVESTYRNDRWVQKKGSRNLPPEVVEDSDDSEGSSCPFHRG